MIQQSGSGEGRLFGILAGRKRRESHHAGKKNLDGYLVPYGPMHWLSLFQMNGCSGRKAQPIKYFPPEELSLFDSG